jgi:hypothetical protein
VTVADDNEKRHNQCKSRRKLTARIKKAGMVLLEGDFRDLGACSKERDFRCWPSAAAESGKMYLGAVSGIYFLNAFFAI